MKRYILRLIGVLAALVLTLVLAVPASAATTAVITVTYQPQFIAITIAPTTWTINSETGNSKLLVNTTYYSNPLGSTTSPTVGGATDAEAAFTITNTSNVVTDITVISANATGGSDAMNNSDNGTAGPTTYGAKSYFTGQTSGQWVVAKSGGSAVGLDSLAATTNIKTGIVFATKLNAWAGSTQSTFDITFTATAH